MDACVFTLARIKSHHRLRKIAPINNGPFYLIRMVIGDPVTCDGITLEPALTFGYIAGEQIAGHVS